MEKKETNYTRRVREVKEYIKLAVIKDDYTDILLEMVEIIEQNNERGVTTVSHEWMNDNYHLDFKYYPKEQLFSFVILGARDNSLLFNLLY